MENMNLKRLKTYEEFANGITADDKERAKKRLKKEQEEVDNAEQNIAAGLEKELGNLRQQHGDNRTIE